MRGWIKLNRYKAKWSGVDVNSSDFDGEKIDSKHPKN
jgi:hypothetical protein